MRRIDTWDDCTEVAWIEAFVCPNAGPVKKALEL